MSHPDNMWPNGRLRHDATEQELLAEIEWQKAWRKEVRRVDGNNYRAQHGTDNIITLQTRLKALRAR